MRKLLHTLLFCPAILASYWLISPVMPAASNAYALGVPTKGLQDDQKLGNPDHTTQESEYIKGKRVAQLGTGFPSGAATGDREIPANSPSSIEQISSGSSVRSSQMTSVSQLSDVQPSDWAFQALQSLVERYGCITGHPDGTYRGNQALTRYEFAAGLNACLNRVNELIATTTNLVRQEDLTTIKQLQAEFPTELSILRSRVDKLEASTAQVETHQFSTTTKLLGQMILSPNVGGFSGRRIIDARGNTRSTNQPNATFPYRADLDLNTSFNGTDLLKIRFDSVTGFGRDNAAGYLEPYLGSALEYTVRGTPPITTNAENGQTQFSFGLSRLYYTFTPSKNLNLTVGSTFLASDFVDINSYANGIVDFSTLALVNNYLLFPLGPSSGVAFNWNPGQGPFKVRGVYGAGNPNSNQACNVNPGSNAPPGGTAGSPSSNPPPGGTAGSPSSNPPPGGTAGSPSSNPPPGGTAGNPSSNQPDLPPGFTSIFSLLYSTCGGGGLFGSPYQGILEVEYSFSKAFTMRLEYSGGSFSTRHFEVLGANLELALNKQLALFGRYGYGSYNGTTFGNIHPNYWMAGISLRDLFVQGAVAGVAGGQPFIDNAVGNATQTNIEAFYNFPVSHNIRVTPLLQVITNPGNQHSNGAIFTGTIRTIFQF